MNLISDFDDYASVGDFVVRKHKTVDNTAYVMCMKTGHRWMHDDLSEALYDARNRFYDSMKGK